MTGNKDQEAITPGNAAEPPAAAIITSMPRLDAVVPYSLAASGFRWADITDNSLDIPSSVNVFIVSCPKSSSVLLPITTPTRGMICTPIFLYC